MILRTEKHKDDLKGSERLGMIKLNYEQETKIDSVIR